MKQSIIFGLSLLILSFLDLASYSQYENYSLADRQKNSLHFSFKNNTHHHLQSINTEYVQDSLTKKSSVSPVINLRGGFGSNNRSPYSVAVGLQGHTKLKEKWFVQGKYAFIYENPERHLREIQDSLGIILGVGYAQKSGNSLFGHYYSGSIFFKASDHFSFEMGRGKHFWGNGYRSLILSHNAAPYPYFKINTQVWKINYVNLWTRLREKFDDSFSHKYIAFHALSWNVSSRWNISLYESVIWQTNDTLNQRGLDFNYLNPVIFYRPVEHALGSADNVLVGASISYQPNEKTLLYSQLLLDEFLLKEVRARSGWWANKYGLQLGIKSFDVFHSNIDLQSEINFARPYTYSHASSLQNYGHQLQSLAHPLETNFAEWITNLHYSYRSWELNNSFIWAIYGRDQLGLNQGGNIYTSYRHVAEKYGNHIAQGRKTIILSNSFSFDRFLDQKKSIRVGLTNLCRYEDENSKNLLDIYLLLHVKINPIPRNIDR